VKIIAPETMCMSSYREINESRNLYYFCSGTSAFSFYWFRLACSSIILFGNGVHDDISWHWFPLMHSSASHQIIPVDINTCGGLDIE
jgi:hypothetical protein